MKKSIVAVNGCSYMSNLKDIKKSLKESFYSLGGLPLKFYTAKTIFIKVNLVGYLFTAREDRGKLFKQRPVASTDKELVEAFIIILREINPNIIINIGEGIDTLENENSDDIWEMSGYKALAVKYGVNLINLNTEKSMLVSLPDNKGMHYKYWINEIAYRSDIKVSISKLKLHSSASITLSIKNMFGCIPNNYYGVNDRSLLHGNPVRLLRSIIDVYRLLKTDLSIIDGIITCEGNFIGNPINMGCIIVGTDAVATDSVGSMLMGIDPENNFPNYPFLSSENYLKIANALKLGNIYRKNIIIKGYDIEKFIRVFKLKRVKEYSSVEVKKWVYKSAEAAVFYNNNRSIFIEKFFHEWIYIHEANVIYHTLSKENFIKKIRLLHRKYIWGFTTKVEYKNDDFENYDIYEDVLKGLTIYNVLLNQI